MELPIYKSNKYATMSSLRNNYRSHKALLEIPSTLFYGGTLKSFASDERQEACIAWEGLQKRKVSDESVPNAPTNSAFPLLFYDAKLGEHNSLVDTPSYFNREECKIVVSIVTRLLSSKHVNCQANEIAVITPFRAQVLKLREGLRKANLGLVGVGQVEDYQGQEAKIVIVSCVLTSEVPKFNATGNEAFGFMRDPKRFNVALSRAESLAIVVGSVSFLESSGYYWAALIEHCRLKSALCDSNGDIQEEGENDENEGLEVKSGLDLLMEKADQLGMGNEKHRLENVLNGCDYFFDSNPVWRITL